MPKSNNERGKLFKDKKKHGGLFKRKDFYVHPDDEPELREHEKQLREKRLKDAGE